MGRSVDQRRVQCRVVGGCGWNGGGERVSGWVGECCTGWQVGWWRCACVRVCGLCEHSSRHQQRHPSQHQNRPSQHQRLRHKSQRQHLRQVGQEKSHPESGCAVDPKTKGVDQKWQEWLVEVGVPFAAPTLSFAERTPPSVTAAPPKTHP